MIKKLTIKDNSSFIYLTKPVLALLRAIPKETKFLFTIKEKTLYITKAQDENENEAFIVKIRKLGSGFGIYMPKSILELIEIDPFEDLVDITVEEFTIILKKA